MTSSAIATGFGRLMTAMVTPFREDGAVDFARAADLARRLVDQGTETLVVCGTTGESPTLTREEKLKLFETVRAAVEVPMVAGTGSNCTRATIELSQAAAERGADALLVVTPYYNKPPQEGIVAHFQALAEAVACPLIAYNIPGRTGTEIAPETLARLARIPSVVAVKQSLPSLEPVSAVESLLARAEGPGATSKAPWVRPGRALETYSGDDSATLPMMAVGAIGAVSVASHLVGPRIREMMDHAAAGRIEPARALHLQLYPLFTGLFATSNPILVKAGLALQGFPVGGLRAPLLSATPAQVQALEQVMRATGAL